ncbi:MAG: porphobilinogen synthase [Firmicutes bacterium HGW-Firmicutes-2]|nr:MAG: porphobilinogen synthase [Firmicutes bacterium HGW-Firmicutes-2]
MGYLPTRLRQHGVLRKMVRNVHLTMDDMIYPIFMVEGENVYKEIESMKGQYHISVDQLERLVPQWQSKGIKSLLIFGVPDEKDAEGVCAYDDNGIVQKALRAIKAISPEIFLITDICLCQYKSDGHCCFFDPQGKIKREETLRTLDKIAISHGKAGADMVAPSDMMDGRINSLRTALDKNGFEHLPIMAYSAKYASSFYGPFRDAAHSAPAMGDRQAYQMDFHRASEAINEFELDVKEGADILMVKPAMPYLDIVSKASERFNRPIAAYQVSGEYAMLERAVRENLIAEKSIYESLIAIKRAGAILILSYFAPVVEELIEKYSE